MSLMNSSRDRLGFSGRIEVHDPAADAELTVLVDRILTREAGEREPLAKLLRRNLEARSHEDPARSQPRRIGQSRQERPRRRDDDAGGSAREGVQRPRARRRDLQVWRETPVRIDFLRRERQNAPYGVYLAQPLQAAEEKPHVRGQPLDVRVGRHDDEDRRVLGERRRMERGCGRREPDSRGAAPPGTGGRLDGDRNPSDAGGT
jgi:hypothetical protein